MECAGELNLVAGLVREVGYTPPSQQPAVGASPFFPPSLFYTLARELFHEFYPH